MNTNQCFLKQRVRLQPKKRRWVRRTSVEKCEEINESENRHESGVDLPPYPHFLLRCEVRQWEYIRRIESALREILEMSCRRFVLDCGHWGSE